jgi:MoaA/NifB/PqqE/SkfB family radical SAM enzyme
MPIETARRTVDFIVDYAKQHGQRAVFSFFGGEPMMAWPTLRDMVLYAEKVAADAGVIALFRMNTNGMLIKDEHLKFFEEHDLTSSCRSTAQGDARPRARHQSGAARSTCSRRSCRSSSSTTRG